MSIIRLDRVSKFYHNKNNITSGFNKVSLKLDIGEFVVITGESGSGKSTLLNVISGLDSYEEGEMYINGKETSHYSEKDYEDYRRKYIGNIFQNFNLVNSYTVYQNIELVLLLNGENKKDIRKRILEVIDMVKLTKYKNTKVSKLSGGQKQRVGIARALVKDTPIIVADEPTGNIDKENAAGIVKLLKEISKDKLVVVVTHNYEQFEKYLTRRIVMHDGKIILDKKEEKIEKIEEKVYDYKNIKWYNKLLLSIRNVFNIKTKFLLLLFIYLILTMFVFSSYSSIRKTNYDSAFDGGNPVFNDTSKERIILNKKDKSSFTNEELDSISKLSNIDKVIEDDIFLDVLSVLSNYDFYYDGSIRSINEIKKVEYGRLPENDNEVIVKVPAYLFMKSELDRIYSKPFSLICTDGAFTLKDLKVVGVIVDDKSAYSTVYVNDSILDKVRKINNIYYSDVYLTLNNKIYKALDDDRLYYSIKPNDKLEEGKALVFDNLNANCDKYVCKNKSINIKIKNIYFEENIDLTINDTYTDKNFTSKTGLTQNDYELDSNIIYISNTDYDRLFSKDTYQISVMVKDEKQISATIKTLNNMNYNTYRVNDMKVDVMKQLLIVIKTIRKISFIISITALFFICYFIIKIILKSRNTYFSVIRTLGANKKVLTSLLNIELFIDINIAYFIFIFFISLVKQKIINITYLHQMTEFFNLNDYIVIYIILVIMSLLISNRYSSKLFSSSVMKNYREEL